VTAKRKKKKKRRRGEGKKRENHPARGTSTGGKTSRRRLPNVSSIGAQSGSHLRVVEEQPGNPERFLAE